MSIKYYANRVQETSTTTGTGNFILGGAPLGYRTFVNGIGANNKFNYYIYRQDTNFEWEIGVGYVTSTGGVNQLVREKVLSSSNNTSLVGFTSGTKYIETIVSQDRINTSFINVEEKSSNFFPPYIPTTYIVDASVSGVQVSLPSVLSQDDPIILGFVLNKTIGNTYEQANAIKLVPNGAEKIAGATGIDVSILNDYLQIVSVPSQSGWALLDPIQDATNPYGNEGTIQFKSNGAFSGVDQLTWNSTSNKLLIGNSGVLSANIVLSSSSGQTNIFNQNLYDNDFRIGGSGVSHLLFVDGGLGRVSINSSAPSDTLLVNANTGSGITISKSGTGPSLLLNNTSISGITSNNIIGSVDFHGLNSVGGVISYGSINSVIESNIDNAEYSSITIETLNNGAIEEIAIFSPSGITLGSNSQNIDGISLGAGSSNEGNNIVLGYYHNVCGESCIAIGHGNVLASGTFGGAIGSDHSSSGNNIWVVGGSGVNVSGNNKTYLAIDNSNYLLLQSGNLEYSTFKSGNSSFNLNNTYVLGDSAPNGVGYHSINFLHNNGSVSFTGVTIKSIVTDAGYNDDDTQSRLSITLDNYGQKTIGLDINPINRTILLGDNSTSSFSDNILIGNDISVTGNNNVIISSNPYSFYGNDTVQLYLNQYNNIKITSSGTYITGPGSNGLKTTSLQVTGIWGISNSGSFVNAGQSVFTDWVRCESGLILNNMVTPTGSNYISTVMPTGQNRIHKLVYQQDPNNTSLNSRVRYEQLASSGSFVTPLQLSANDAEYQFLTPTGASIIYLPNGTGLYMGKKFDIFNMHTSNNITIRKSGSASDIETVIPGRHMSIIHAGNNNWVRIVSSGIN